MIVVVTSFYRTQAMSSFLFFSYLLHFNCKFVMMKNYFKGRHFQKDIILVAVGYYLRFSLSYRDLVEILRDRGIAVHHTTIMRWVHHYGPIFKLLWRKQQHATSQSWRMDETYLKIKRKLQEQVSH